MTKFYKEFVTLCMFSLLNCNPKDFELIRIKSNECFIFNPPEKIYFNGEFGFHIDIFLKNLETRVFCFIIDGVALI